MEQQYCDLLRDILENGDDRMDRTGVGTRAVFGRQLRHHLSQGFPLLTTKKTFFKPILGELLWFLEGSSDERRLAEITFGTRDPDKKTIWTGNAQAPYWKPKAKFEGDLGRVYGVQWRKWKSVELKSFNDAECDENVEGFTINKAKVHVTYIDQIADIINKLKNNPTDRRMILTAFNVGEIAQMALPPCHMFCQFFVNAAKNELSCTVYMRSVDVFLGLPFNIASYSLLTHMIAHVTEYKPGEVIMSLGDTHIYNNHVEQVREQLSREAYPLPEISLNPNVKSIDDFTMADFTLINYQSHPAIKAPMAV